MSTKTLNKAILAEIIYTEIGISFAESTKLVDIFFEELTKGLTTDKVAKIPSFGSFQISSKRAREGRNPKTKITAKIQARNVVHFYASRQLRNLINKAN